MNCWNWWLRDKEVFLTRSAFPLDYSTLEEHILHRTVFLLQKKNQIIKHTIKVSVQTYIKFDLTVIPMSISEWARKQDPILIVQYTQAMVFMMRKSRYTGREQDSKPVTAWKAVSQHKKCLPLIFFQALWSETVLRKTMWWLCGKPFVYPQGTKKCLFKTFTNGWLKLPNRNRLAAKPNF